MASHISHFIKKPAQIKNNYGFTLIEIIMVLLLISIIGSMGTIGIVSYAKSYNLAQEATQTMGTGQLAMLRMVKEFVAINTVTSATSSAITFKTQHADGEHTLTFSKSGTNLILTEGASQDTLASQVDAFSLEYYEWSYSSNSLVQTTPGAWVDEVTCCTPISISTTKAECKGSGNELKIKFTDDVNGFTETFNVTYAGVDYDACEDGDHYDVTHQSRNADGSCNSKAVPSQSWYDKAYIWDTTSGAKCYAEISIINDTDDPCPVGSGTNPPPPGLVGGTKIIKASLTISGYPPFTISAAPRNINSCP